jgi:hypothetical protein
MDRGLLAPLSPNEELALRRIAHGIAGLREINKREIKHLAALNLIVSDGITVSMTKHGLNRVTHLPHVGPPAMSKGDKTTATMAKALGVKDS